MEEQQTRDKKTTEEKVLKVYFSRPRAAIDEEQLCIIEEIIKKDLSKNKEEQSAFFGKMLRLFDEKSDKYIEIERQQENLLIDLDLVTWEVDQMDRQFDIDKEGAIDKILGLAEKEGISKNVRNRMGSSWLLSKTKGRDPRKLCHAFWVESFHKNVRFHDELWRTIALSKYNYTPEKLGNLVRSFGMMIDHFERADLLNKGGFSAIEIYRDYIYANYRRARALAFAMTQHERLGQRSGVPSHMPKELMRRIHKSSLL